ncbi:TIGR02757 family protein [Anaeromyxobacter diazotrophicus]|uniref:TIGR02757 family protein n=1 Tax=Anaeromyxobacter diazotrophicus TaxID=2590199 RepID=A0A7I9VPL8_9BACT|nr:TIGR02757 family protein [Anaeromyxobacter diazotrophicus]GEJ57907.1 TIGR02757 family protein [Anaeromyxobacter diazotrophicus]
MARGTSRPISPARARTLLPLLEQLERGFDKRARLGFDPVELPRRHADPADQEVAGLFAAALAYGRADLFKPQLERVLGEMGPSPARFCDRFARAPRPGAFAGFRYRFNLPEDVAALAAAAGHLRLLHGSLGARFAALLAGEGGQLRPALARFARELREAPPARALLARRGPRGLAHLLPDAGLAGACKRWHLYLRWMVRGPDAIDLGVWRGVPPAALLVPLDTHVARIARHLGLTRREDMSWRTAEEITAGLRLLDPADPVRFDFVLCHLGMSGACPLRRDPARCAQCALAPACRARARPPGSARAGL